MRALRCYCCESEATTEEHVPPRCLFPEEKDLQFGVNLRNTLIKVPSCAEHNLKKSGDDEHLMYVLTMNMSANLVGESHLTSKVYRAIRRRPALANRILAKSSPIVVHDPRTGEKRDTLAVEGDSKRIDGSLRQIALGLYRHHFGRNWTGSLRAIPEFFRHLRDGQADAWNAALAEASQYADALFANEVSYGANDAVFSYQVVAPNPQESVVMRLRFYGDCKVIVFFG